jgi:hypothetical protein
MMWQQWSRTVLIAGAAIAVLVSGCGQTENKQAQGKAVKTSTANASDAKHDDWWCDEHGMPEDECSMCSAKVAKACKANGDWCKEHDRAKSQCFICDPALREKYAARYRAKYGKEPPPPTDNMPKTDAPKAKE